MFSKFARLITIESKRAGGIITDPGLQAVIARAKAANMPKDNIERAVTKGTSKDAGSLEAVLYEFYGPGGSAAIISALTDNRNRMTQEIKHVLTRNGYELGAQGSAQWAFTKQSDGTFVPASTIELSEEDGEKLGNVLETLDEHDDVQAAYTNALGFESTE